MNLAIFPISFVLFFFSFLASFGQSVDNEISIQLEPTSFSIERPFAIIVNIENSDNRPSISFPDIIGFTKKGVTVSVTSAEIGGKTVSNQIITQNYQARAPGRFRVPPFVLQVNGSAVRSEGAMLTVRPLPSAIDAATQPTAPPTSADAAFLSMRTSSQRIYAGEGIAYTLSFYVVDNYPYVLNFTNLDKQLQAITKKIRPANAWEENRNITELKPVTIMIRGKLYREYRLFEAVYFPLSARSLQVPGVSLELSKRPVVGPPEDHPETISFSSNPVSIAVRPLPPHPLRGKVPVGSFQLEESLERQQIKTGQSVRYTFAVTGEGNIATLPAPLLVPESSANVDVFPPQEKQVIDHVDKRITGRKAFSYFIVPYANGLVSLADRFQWVYFDPQTARYDTLRSHLALQVGSEGGRASSPGSLSGTLASAGEGLSVAVGEGSFYAGLEAQDSTRQPISLSVLVRALANVVLMLMLLGMVFIFFRK